MSGRKPFYFLVVGCSVLVLLMLKNDIKYGLIKKLPLEYERDDFDRWAEETDPQTFKVYVFHVRNPDEVTYNGESPRVQEIGPYVYKYYRRKEKIEYVIEDDVWKYKEYHFLDFDATASAPLSDSDVVTVLNVPLQSLEDSGRTVRANLNVEWSSALDHASELFHDVRVGDYLLGGYRFCVPQVAEEEPSTFCAAARKATASSRLFFLEEDSSVVFSFFAHKNFNDDGQYEVTAGSVDINDLGRIRNWNEAEYLTAWLGKESSCNKIRGTHSSIFPPFTPDWDNSVVETYCTDVCRAVELRWTGTETIGGVTGEVIASTRDVFGNGKGEDSDCYCIKRTKNLEGASKCLPDGFGDMMSCLGAPLVVSQPHLLWADQIYGRTVIGLAPSERKHSTKIIIEPRTGITLRANKRLQYNMFIRPIDQIYITSGVEPSVLPLLWFDEVTEVSDDLMCKLKTDYLKHDDFDFCW